MRPLHNNVLLKRLPVDELADRTPAGLWLPQQSVDVHQRHMQGEVVAIGPEVEQAELVPGMRVLTGRYDRAWLDKDGEYWIVNENSCQAIILGED